MCHLWDSKSQALPVFHALTGTSAFREKIVQQVWQVYEEVTETFWYLHGWSSIWGQYWMIIVVLYDDKTSPLSTVNETKEELFCEKNQNSDRIPLTKNALLQNTWWTVYQVGNWATSTQVQQMVPSPGEYAWTKHYIMATSLDNFSWACRELMKIMFL